MAGHDSAASIAPNAIPDAVLEILAALRAEGFASYLVGGCVRDLLQRRPVHDYDVATAAAPDAVLARFERAIPIGLRHGTVMLPTPAGPVDVTTFRAGPNIEADLARRDFTLNALAYDPFEARVIDPFEGWRDLVQGRLRAVASARDRFNEDPLRALRAARLVSSMGLTADPSIAESMKWVADRVAKLPGERLRAELDRLVVGAHVATAVDMLRDSGIEALLIPGASPHAAERMGQLPPERLPRWTAWLLGTRVPSVLARLRYPRRTAERIGRLVRLHPIDQRFDAKSPVQVRRLIKQAGRENLTALLALAEASYRVELEAGGALDAALHRVRQLEQALDEALRSKTLALHRADLALTGADVIAQLGCKPGPRVGHALRYLTECVLKDPTCNTPELLSSKLRDWNKSQA